uniref:Caspase-6 n=1 Tax=Geotrypetes seraphini TaxID=260995 RepID=A0A6P8S2I8_GEOSA|nr:caspase-6 isoform X1 [Geotrypetes seraphini]
MAGQLETDSKQDLNTKGGNINLLETDSLSSLLSGTTDLDPAEEYNMKHKRRGVALIFNHEWFHWCLTMPERRGTNADKDNLIRRLRELGFEVSWFDNLRAEEVLQKLHTASTEDHSDADCFLCVFLSHGEDNHIYAFDAKIEINMITNMFKGDKCPSLVGKPKIFIVQACRGEKHDDPVICTDSVDNRLEKPTTNEVEVDAASVHTLPAGADFVMCYSVAEEMAAKRNPNFGSEDSRLLATLFLPKEHHYFKIAGRGGPSCNFEPPGSASPGGIIAWLPFPGIWKTYANVASSCDGRSRAFSRGCGAN